MKEICKDIKNFEGSYQVSNMGSIRSLDRYVKTKDSKEQFNKGITLKLSISRCGYFKVAIYNVSGRKDKRIHRLVANAFIPNPENKSEVNHKDGNKQNNHVDNLEWVTPKENTQHAFKMGLRTGKQVTGIKNPMAKLDKYKVHQIRTLYDIGNYSYKSLGYIFNVSGSTIGRVVRYELWKTNLN